MKESYKIKIDAERTIGRIDPNIYGHFIEHMSRCIYGGIYEEGSNLSDEEGFRKGVLEAVKKIKIPILRWPGGNFASGYHWEDGIGPKENRAIRYDPAWRVEETNHFGTQEFLNFCAKVNAEPYICVNMGDGNIKEVVNWVEYCNHEGNSYYAQLRKRHGHAKSYRVRYWGLGNEVYAEWQIGYKSADDYSKIAKEFAKAMKWVDPKIKLIATGADNPEWDYKVVKSLKNYIDYISIHAYYSCLSKDYHKAMAISKIVEDRTKVLKGVIDAGVNSSDSHVGIAWDEWNMLNWLHYEKHLENDNNCYYNLQNALVTASVLNAFQRLCNIVKMANYSPLVNIRGAIFTHSGGIVLRPQYHVFNLYANHSGEVVLDPLVDSESYTCTLSAEERKTVKYINKNVKVDFLDVSASFDENKLFIAVVNKHDSEDIISRIDLRGFIPSSGNVYQIAPKKLHSYNDVDNPEEVRVERIKLNRIQSTFEYQFPAHSVTILDIETR